MKNASAHQMTQHDYCFCLESSLHLSTEVFAVHMLFYRLHNRVDFMRASLQPLSVGETVNLHSLNTSLY